MTVLSSVIYTKDLHILGDTWPNDNITLRQFFDMAKIYFPYIYSKPLLLVHT